MKKVKVKFVDRPTNVDTVGSLGEKGENVILEALEKRFDVEISDSPDIIFSYVPVGDATGAEYLDYDCVKCQVLQESVYPDFNCFDYAIGLFHDFRYADRYFYIPGAVYYTQSTRTSWNMALKKYEDVEKKLVDRKFCSFVVSNSADADKKRTEIFNLLNQYRKVDSGGRYLNNVGGPVKDKLEFDLQHKFSIIFENIYYSCVTEKIVMGFAAKTVPIYWGNQDIGKLFNEKAFINCHKYSSLEEVVKKVIQIDNDEDAYLNMLRESAILDRKTSEEWIEDLADFLENMIDTPRERAIIRTDVGWSEQMQYVRKCGVKKLYKRKRRRSLLFSFGSKLFGKWKNTRLAMRVKALILHRSI